jgi:hypothetical protein
MQSSLLYYKMADGMMKDPGLDGMKQPPVANSYKFNLVDFFIGQCTGLGVKV